MIPDSSIPKGVEIAPSDQTQIVAAEAYQVIGALAHAAGLFDTPEVTKALDYFGDIANGDKPTRAKEILPWHIDSTRVAPESLIRCGKCGKTWEEDDVVEQQECLHKHDVGGYGSVFGDMQEWSITLCQECAHGLLSPYILWYEE